MSPIPITLIRRLFFIVTGYSVAVVVSSAVTLFCLDVSGVNFFTGLRNNPPLKGFLTVLPIACIYTAITSVLPAGFYIAVCEKFGRPGLKIHAIAGGITALVAHIIFFLVFDRDLKIVSPTLVFFSLIGGALGALAYWRIAVARYTDPPLPFTETF